VLARYRRAPLRRLVETSVVAVSGDPAAETARIAAKAAVTIVLSSELVRYALLPWTPRLRSAAEWRDYARHTFSSTYGEAAAAGWEVHFCSTGFRRARLAVAVDAALLASLRALPGLVSIQPHLMSAFNARRRALRGRNAWLVLQEEGRLTAALLRNGDWHVIRSRRTHGDWQRALRDLLDREAAAAGEGCDDVVLCSEAPAPSRLGRYRVAARPANMALA
jgi:hypothetical protein